MGYTAAEAHVHADQLGRHLHRRHGGADRREARPSGAVPARLAGRSGLRAGGEPQLAPLSDLEAGARATIVRLAEHDGDLLHWFYDEGLVPGRELEVARLSRPPAR